MNNCDEKKLNAPLVCPRCHKFPVFEFMKRKVATNDPPTEDKIYECARCFLVWAIQVKETSQ